MHVRFPLFFPIRDVLPTVFSCVSLIDFTLSNPRTNIIAVAKQDLANRCREDSIRTGRYISQSIPVDRLSDSASASETMITCK